MQLKNFTIFTFVIYKKHRTEFYSEFYFFQKSYNEVSIEYP